MKQPGSFVVDKEPKQIEMSEKFVQDHPEWYPAAAVVFFCPILLPTTDVVGGKVMFSQVFVHRGEWGGVCPVLVLPSGGGGTSCPGHACEDGCHDQVTPTALPPPPPQS